jgi:hypothetical protein
MAIVIMGRRGEKKTDAGSRVVQLCMALGMLVTIRLKASRGSNHEHAHIQK